MAPSTGPSGAPAGGVPWIAWTKKPSGSRMMIDIALPIDVGAVTAAAPFVMMGAFTFFAAATMASMSRTISFSIGAPGSAMSGCLFNWRSTLPNSVNSKCR